MAISIDGSTGVELEDNDKQIFGTGNDLEIYHDGSNSYLVNTTGFLKIKDESNVRIDTDAFAVNKGDNSEAMIVATADASVDLYYDNTKTFSTQTNGIAAYGSEGNDAYVYIFADEADDHADQWRIKGWQASQTLSIEYRNSGGSYENSILCNGDGNVKLFYNNTEVVETHSAGLLINQNYALYMVAGNWTGDTTGKIQAHADHLYFQNCHNTGKWVFRLPNGTEPAQIDHNGTFGSSDERRKKDITTITNAVSTVKQLTGRSFAWKETDQKSFGVIAQEVEPVLPDIVTTQTVPEGVTDNDPYKMVNYAALSGHFIEAIKELSAEVDILKAKVAALEGA